MTDQIQKTDDFMRSIGAETYRVGGSVRDQILQRKAKDADYVVRGCTLQQLKNGLSLAGAKALPLVLRDGQQGGWRAIYKGTAIEVMLPRTEVSTGPRHQDFKLVLDKDLPLIVDAQRRDFRFNAIYIDLTSMKVIDPLHGVNDLLARTINVTHPDSFRDDPLRILRALRFVSTLGYELGSDTRALMHVHADAANGLTADGHASGTVLAEMQKLLMGEKPAEALRVARDTGVLAVAFPELAQMLGFDQGSRYHDLTTDEHTFKALETAAHVDAPLRVRMALLYHDAGKPRCSWTGTDGRLHYYAMPAKEQQRRADVQQPVRDDQCVDHEVLGEVLWRAAALRMGAEKELREDVATLIRNHMVPCMKVDAVKVHRERVRLGDRMLHDLYLMRMCDLSGKGKANEQHLNIVAQMEAIRQDAEQTQVPASLRELAITGSDVQAGRTTGDILRQVLDEVVCQPDELRRSREWQLRRVQARKLG